MTMTENSPTTRINRSFLLALIIMGLVEGFSTLALFFVAMPMKYMMDMPMAVTVTGGLHGLFFVVLILMFIVGKTRVPLSTGMTILGIIGAIIPFGPFFVDLKLAQLLRESA
jgi:integral membrane protein